MKIGELREKLSKLKKADVEKLAVEFYKLIPKSKKEEYNLDKLIENPQTAKKSSLKKQINLHLLEFEVNEFIENAKHQYYIFPNQVVSKKERPKWRFKVKRWYKELINTNRPGSDISLQSKILSRLYELLCESLNYHYFSADDSFRSIGIEQKQFFKSVLTLIQLAEGKSDSVEKGIKLMVDNDRYSLSSDLVDELILMLDVPDLKYKGIDIVNGLLDDVKLKLDTKSKRKRQSLDKYEWRNNNLAELGFRLYASLFELDEGIKFYKAHYYQERREIKLFVLVRLLFDINEKDRIIKEIADASKKGIKPRRRLLNLVEKIKETGELPEYF